MSEMKNMTLSVFADELASDSPAPGGGSVAALCSTLAASLSNMVFSLTIDKKFYNEYSEEIKNSIIEGREAANKLKSEFLNFMDEDTAAFNKVMAAFKMPKETDEEKKIRSQRIQESYIAATEVPFKVAKETFKIFDYLETAAKYGNPNAISDAGVGTLAAMTALESAILNVRINLGGIKDKEFVENVSKQCQELVNNAASKKSSIMDIVNSKL